MHVRFSNDFLRWRTVSIKAINRSIIYARVEEARSQKFVTVKRGGDERLRRMKGAGKSMKDVHALVP